MTVVFYDGVCGLCDRLVRFLLRRDRHGRLRFAALQGSLAQEVLVPRGHDVFALDTVYVIAEWQSPTERVLRKSRAVLHAVGQLGGSWSVLAGAAAAIPRPLADLGYDIVARLRYRVFGRFDACAAPPQEWRERFID